MTKPNTIGKLQKVSERQAVDKLTHGSLIAYAGHLHAALYQTYLLMEAGVTTSTTTGTTYLISTKWVATLAYAAKHKQLVT